MSPSYVETDEFRIIGEWRIGCAGRRLWVRAYRLKANPDQRVEEILYTVVHAWALAGSPQDTVLHLGTFYRVTVL